MDSSTITKVTFTLKKDGSNVNTIAEINLEENGKTAILKPKGGFRRRYEVCRYIDKRGKKSSRKQYGFG